MTITCVQHERQKRAKDAFVKEAERSGRSVEFCFALT